MIQILITIFYQPLLNLLVFFYNVIPGHDIGVSIILLTVVLKLVLYPFSIKSLHSQKALQELQPKINALKAQYKDKKELMASEMMKLYKEEKVSPFSSCLPLLVQLPFLFAIYQVFLNGLGAESLSLIYPFITNPGHLSPIAFGFLDLSKSNWILAILAAAAQFWQAKMLVGKKPEVKAPGSKDENMAAMMNKQMTIFMPIMTLVIGMSLPGGLVMYWFVVTVLTALQQIITFRSIDRKKALAKA